MDEIEILKKAGGKLKQFKKKEVIFFESEHAISSLDSQDRLLSLFAYLKDDQKIKNEDDSYTINLTRKEIAELTGLRIETVIRSVKKMVSEGKLKMEKRKIIYTTI